MTSSAIDPDLAWTAHFDGVTKIHIEICGKGRNMFVLSELSKSPTHGFVKQKRNNSTMSNPFVPSKPIPDCEIEKEIWILLLRFVASGRRTSLSFSINLELFNQILAEETPNECMIWNMWYLQFIILPQVHHSFNLSNQQLRFDIAVLFHRRC